MPKRKLISLLRRRSNHENEEERYSDLSTDGEISTKRIRPDLSPGSTGDEEQHNSDIDQANSLSSEENNEQNSDASENSTMNLPCSNATDAELMNNSQYDGYQNFMNSFQFFSDEESCESDSQESVQQYFKVKKQRKSFKKVNKSKIAKQAYIEWQDQSEYSYFDEDNVRLQTISGKVRVLGYYLKNLEVVFMDHPSSVPIVGYMKVTLIAGKASIQGYALEINKPVTVFSQKQSGILSVISHYYEEEKVCDMQNNVQTKLTEYLTGITSERVRDYIKQNMRYSSAVFVLQGCILPPALQFLQLYSPYAVSFETKNKSMDNLEIKTKFTVFTENDENVLKFGPEYEEIFTTIHKHLLRINGGKPGERKPVEKMNISSSEDNLEKKPVLKEISGFRILISGPKKAGKSTMLRYLVNSFLNKYPEVYYLDTDPGQSEFTPPGAINLVKVTEPVFGPPYSHLRAPLRKVFTGTITPETSPPMHMRSISKLIDHFNLSFPDSILVVNTIGWLTGVGNLIQNHIRKCLMPGVEIELYPGLSPLNISVEGKLLTCTVGFERDAASSTKQGDNRPSDLRDWALLAYIGQCQRFYLQPLSLNALRPLCVCWDEIAVYNFNKRLVYNRYYEALNGSVVALCHIKPSFMVLPEKRDYPVTLKEEPDNFCYGYGIVRAVDEERHLLYIVTPLSSNALNEKINALLSGNILIPRDVIYEQRILDVELYYTDGSREGRTELRKAIRKRSRGHSSKDRF